MVVLVETNQVICVSSESSAKSESNEIGEGREPAGWACACGLSKLLWVLLLLHLLRIDHLGLSWLLLVHHHRLLLSRHLSEHLWALTVPVGILLLLRELLAARLHVLLHDRLLLLLLLRGVLLG